MYGTTLVVGVAHCWQLSLGPHPLVSSSSTFNTGVMSTNKSQEPPEHCSGYDPSFEGPRGAFENLECDSTLWTIVQSYLGWKLYGHHLRYHLDLLTTLHNKHSQLHHKHLHPHVRHLYQNLYPSVV